jgi:hypothetical protein
VGATVVIMTLLPSGRQQSHDHGWEARPRS